MNLLKEDAYILAINIPNRTYLLEKVSNFSIKSIENISNKFRPLQELFNRFNSSKYPNKLCNSKVLSV